MVSLQRHHNQEVSSDILLLSNTHLLLGCTEAFQGQRGCIIFSASSYFPPYGKCSEFLQERSPGHIQTTSSDSFTEEGQELHLEIHEDVRAPNSIPEAGFHSLAFRMFVFQTWVGLVLRMQTQLLLHLKWDLIVLGSIYIMRGFNVLGKVVCFTWSPLHTVF